MFFLKIKIIYSEDLSDSLTQAVNDAVRQVIQASGEDVVLTSTTTPRTTTSSSQPSCLGSGSSTRPIGLSHLPHPMTGRPRSGNIQRSTGRSKLK